MGARVKQGSSTSCNIFTSYIGPTVDDVKASGWLEDIHILFMDDTVMIASPRDSLRDKLKVEKHSL